MPSRFRAHVLGLVIACTTVGAFTTNADASLSYAVVFEDLVESSSVVAVATAMEQKSVWENNRIYTYSRLRVEDAVAGDTKRGQEVWVRTMGGAVDNVGQRVDGEATFLPGKASLVFLTKGEAGSFDVASRAQGQFPVIREEVTKRLLVMKSAVTGPLIAPPKERLAKVRPGLRPQSIGQAPLAAEVLDGRPLEDVVRDVAAVWRSLHK